MLEKFDKNKNPFTVPENYFEGLTDNIMSSLPKEEKVAKKVSLWKKVAPWASIAAAVVMIFVAVNVLQDGPTDSRMVQVIGKEDNKSEEVYYDEYSEEDYYLFLEEEAITAAYVDVVLLGE